MVLGVWQTRFLLDWLENIFCINIYEVCFGQQLIRLKGYVDEFGSDVKGFEFFLERTSGKACIFTFFIKRTLSSIGTFFYQKNPTFGVQIHETYGAGCHMFRVFVRQT